MSNDPPKLRLASKNSDADLEMRGALDRLDWPLRIFVANLLRVMRGAEQVALRLQKARPPSFVTIEQLDGGVAEVPKY